MDRGAESRGHEQRAPERGMDGKERVPNENCSVPVREFANWPICYTPRAQPCTRRPGEHRSEGKDGREDGAGLSRTKGSPDPTADMTAR